MNLLLMSLLVMTITRHHQLHHILEMKLHFFERDFHLEVFHVPVRLSDEFLKPAFTAGVFFVEAAIFLIRFHQGLSDIVRRNRHPYPPGWSVVHITVTITTLRL